MKVYEKLVRDRIPEIIRADGKTPIVRTLGPEEYKAALMAKLDEETAEFKANPCVEELADIAEVIDAAAEAIGSSMAEVLEAKARKKLARGGFQGRVWLEREE